MNGVRVCVCLTLLLLPQVARAQFVEMKDADVARFVAVIGANLRDTKRLVTAANADQEEARAAEAAHNALVDSLKNELLDLRARFERMHGKIAVPAKARLDRDCSLKMSPEGKDVVFWTGEFAAADTILIQGFSNGNVSADNSVSALAGFVGKAPAARTTQDAVSFYQGQGFTLNAQDATVFLFERQANAPYKVMVQFMGAPQDECDAVGPSITFQAVDAPVTERARGHLETSSDSVTLPGALARNNVTREQFDQWQATWLMIIGDLAEPTSMDGLDGSPELRAMVAMRRKNVAWYQRNERALAEVMKLWKEVAN